MLSVYFSRLFSRLALALLAGLSLLSVATPATAQADIDPRWGVLAEMAEQDFIAVKGGAPVTIRWETPNQKLVWSEWYGWQRVKFEFTLIHATGAIMFHNGGIGGCCVEGRADSDGSILLRGKYKLVYKQGEGLYWGGAGQAFRRLNESDGQANKRLVEVISKGKVRAADPALGEATYAATVRPRPSGSSAQAPIQASTAPTIAAPINTFRPKAPRIALIIGNSDYGAAFGSLPNPVRDADAMATALTALGFKVELLKDVDQKNMKRAIARFGANLRRAGRSATGLFFYAGHGLQTGGINYLVPVNAAIEAEADVDLESVAADTVLRQMEEAGTGTNIVILDACRNMPLARSLRSGTRGLARMDAPNGSFVAYSTAPGSVAADGTGRNSPFVTALIANLGRKGQPIETVFRDVRRSVLAATAGRQTPWDSSSLVDPFYFAGE